MGVSFFIALLLFIGVVYFAQFLETREPFIGDPDARRCGVDQPPCPFGTSCVNGWCIETDPPKLPPTTGLPVLP